MKDIDNLTEREQMKLETYLNTHCTSRCFNDIECQHEQEFIDILNEEILNLPHEVVKRTNL